MMVAVGFAAGTLIIALTTYTAVAERRREYGIIKAIGATRAGFLSPIELIPEFLPVIGPLDDIVVVAVALRYAARRIPPQALIDA